MDKRGIHWQEIATALMVIAVIFVVIIVFNSESRAEFKKLIGIREAVTGYNISELGLLTPSEVAKAERTPEGRKALCQAEFKKAEDYKIITYLGVPEESSLEGAFNLYTSFFKKYGGEEVARDCPSDLMTKAKERLGQLKLSLVDKYLQSADLLIEGKRYEDALDKLKKAQAINSEDPRINEKLTLVESKLVKFAGSMTFSAAEKKIKTELEQTGKLNEAILEYQKLIVQFYKLNDIYAVAKSYYDIAEIYSKNPNPEIKVKAYQIYEDILAGPGSTESFATVNRDFIDSVKSKLTEAYKKDPAYKSIGFSGVTFELWIQVPVDEEWGFADYLWSPQGWIETAKFSDLKETYSSKDEEFFILNEKEISDSHISYWSKGGTTENPSSLKDIDQIEKGVPWIMTFRLEDLAGNKICEVKKEIKSYAEGEIKLDEFNAAGCSAAKSLQLTEIHTTNSGADEEWMYFDLTLNLKEPWKGYKYWG